MSVFENYLPKRLSGAAKALGVGPFEVVRLAVAADLAVEKHVFSDEEVEKLKSFADIHDWLGDDPEVDDDNEARGYLRSGLKALLEGGFVGDTTTRIDNLWRHLGDDVRPTVEQAIALLLQGGQLASAASPKGPQVSISSDHKDAIQAFVDDGTEPASLNGLF